MTLLYSQCQLVIHIIMSIGDPHNLSRTTPAFMNLWKQFLNNSLKIICAFGPTRKEPLLDQPYGTWKVNFLRPPFAKPAVVKLWLLRDRHRMKKVGPCWGATESSWIKVLIPTFSVALEDASYRPFMFASLELMHIHLFRACVISKNDPVTLISNTNLPCFKKPVCSS